MAKQFQRSASSWVAGALIAGALCANSAANAAVGRTEGAFSVTPSGAATYQIPIFSPPGPKGLQPNISLVYNSRQLVGPLGRGWGIAGLSSISRCNKTYAQDGRGESVALSTTDGYCIDGARLRIIGGSYGYSGSTYQTEIADFSLITASGTAGNGPASFTVKRKDGLIYEYGSTTDSRVLATGTSTASVWMVNQISDRSGNRIKFTYKTPDSGTTGTTVPLSIEWTATSYGASTFLYKMVFAYGTNVPASSEAAFVAGTAVLNDDALSSIDIQVGGATKKKYFLGYQTSSVTGGLRLIAVTECSDSGGTDCLSPTVVGYQDGQVGVSTTATSLAVNPTYAFTQFDLNGDGIHDMVYKVSGYWYVKFGSTGGFGSAISTGLQGDAWASFLVGDLRGNGQDGMLVLQSGTWNYYYWNGSSFGSSSAGVGMDGGTYAALADVNGDGRPDLVTLIAASSTLNYRLNSSSSSTVGFSSLTSGVSIGDTTDAFFPTDALGAFAGRPLDFNGDGRADFALHQTIQFVWQEPSYGTDVTGTISTTYLIVSAPGGGLTTTVLDSVTDYYTYTPIHYPMFMDINDDGCTDIGWYLTVGVSGCGGAGGAAATLPAGVLAVIDWNGDGRSDVLSINGSGIDVHTSNGTGFNAPIATGITYTAGYWRAADVNGDGLDDLVWGMAPLKYYPHNGTGTRPDLATTFADGYGVSHAVAYAPADWGSHAKLALATYPNVDYQGSEQLVTSVQSSDGIGGTYSRTYAYYGGATNVQGRGFSGFSHKKTTDSRTGAYSIEFYEQSFPTVGSVMRFEQFQSGGALISQRNTSFTTNTLDATANNQRYFVYPIAGSSYRYEVGGSLNGQLIAQTSESNTFDSYGNLTASTRVTTDKDATSYLYNNTWTESVTQIFYPDSSSANWCLGLPAHRTYSYSNSIGETPVSWTNNYGVNNAYCRISDISVGVGGSRQVDNYGYFDSFGNPNRVDVVGRNANGTTMSTRTSYQSFGVTGQFPESSTNALGQVTTRTFNATFGHIATETDPNGIQVRNNVYDSFGRMSTQTKFDGTYATYDYNGPVVGINPRAVLLTSIYSYASNGSLIRGDTIYTDQFGRSVNEYRYSLSGSGYWAAAKTYDAFGRLASEGAPFQASSGYQYTPTFATAYSYDLLGRVVQISRPQSQSVSTPQTTTIAYSGRTQVVTDPQSKTTTKAMDVVGRMRRSQDHNGYYQGFGYDAFGSLKAVVDSSLTTLFTASYSYGAQAFQDSSYDMDLGTRTYSRNSLGELTGWVDAKSQSFSQTFDALSRVTSRTEAEGTTTFTFGTSAGSYNIGRLASVSMPGYSESFGYDNKGRLSTQTVTTDQAYSIDYAYNNQGLLDTLTYPTSTSSARIKVKYGYANGILQSATDWTSGSAGTVYWTANSKNPRGHTTQETLGNGVVTNRAIDAVTGWPSSIQSGVGGGAGLQNQSYLYDLVGNVTQRQENNLGLTENFYYDNLYRLDYSQLNGSTNLDLSYDAMGNITARSDIGGGSSWTYHSTKKHAVTAAGSNSYSYDANGNMTSRAGSTIGWTSYNYPTSLASGSESTTIYYDPNRQYYKQVYVGSSGTETTHYVGGLLEKVALPGGTTDWRHYVRAEGQVVAVVSRMSTGTNSVSYPLEDHQGSASILTSSSGTSLVKESFGAFGLPRNGATWSGAVPSGDKIAINGLSRRGYTYHSMLGDMGLIHMNGRVQDAVTGRFMSPDPYVTDPGFTQNFNRYSYVYNNPLSNIDPSGFATDTELDQEEVPGRRPGGPTVYFGGGSGGGATTGGGAYPDLPADEWDHASHAQCVFMGGCKENLEELPEENVVATPTNMAAKPLPPRYKCTNCGAIHGGTFEPYCPDCNGKSKTPDGGVAPNPNAPEWDRPGYKEPANEPASNSRTSIGWGKIGAGLVVAGGVACLILEPCGAVVGSALATALTVGGAVAVPALAIE
jgi:RHS repeat-associated protein